MANEKRHTVLLDKKSHLKIMLASQGPGTNVLFARFTLPNIPESTRNALAAMIRARLEINGIRSHYKSEHHYFTITSGSSVITEQNNGHVMCDYAKEVMEEVGELTQHGASFRDAVKQVYEADLRILRHMHAEESQERLDAEQDAANVGIARSLKKKDAREAIMRAVERVMPRKEAIAFAEAFSNILVSHYPIRPAITSTPEKNEIEFRGTDEDDLFRLVRNSCNATIIPDPHKRRYAIGEVFDALHEAYENAGEISQEGRYMA